MKCAHMWRLGLARPWSRTLSWLLLAGLLVGDASAQSVRSPLGGTSRSTARRGVPGAPDATFGTDGKVATDFFGGQDQATDLAVQADGKLVVSGVARRADGKAAFALARYNADGSLDATFGSGGKVTTDFSASSEGATSVAIQADGKIVVAGVTCPTTISLSCADFAVARFDPDGTLDESFGTGGKVTTDFTGGFDAALDVAIQGDGKIVAVGVSAPGMISYMSGDIALVRYNANGSLDAGFGAGGKVRTDFAGGFDGSIAVVIQPDGKIVAGGSEARVNDYRDFALIRYNADGSLDAGFGSGGKVMTSFGDGNHGSDGIGGLALQPDGKIVAAGASQEVGDSTVMNHFALARYNADGSLDPSFGAGGMVRTPFPGRDDSQAGSVVVQADGKIVAGGITGATLEVGLNGPVALSEEESDPPTRADFALARYNADGSLDTTFGTGGLVTADFFGSSDALKVVRQPDGKIVGVGYARRERGVTGFLARIVSSPDADFALIRYETGDVVVPDFSIAVEPSAITASRGQKGQVVVRITRTGDFAGSVTISAPNTKAIKVKLTPPTSATTEGLATFNYKIKKKAVLGAHALTFTGRDRDGRERTATLTLAIQ